MADTYEKDLEQKSTLTTSDYIRVVGSDNVSYKQSVSAVADAVGSYNATAILLTDCNDATDPSKIYYANGSTANRPSNAWLFVRCDGEYAPNVYFQTAMSLNATTPLMWTRSSNTSGTWGEWKQVPTRAEVDALSSQFTILQTVANTALSVSVPNNYRGVVYFVDSTTNRCGEYIVYANGSGAVTLLPVKEASGLTISTSTRTITITSAGATRVAFMNMTGTATA